MAFSTDAPHWSMWMFDDIFETLVMPDDLTDPSADWEAGWRILETNNNTSRTSIEGSLDMSLRRQAGVAQVNVVQNTPMFWGMSIETTVSATCRDGLMLRPLRWSTEFVTRTSTADKEGTDGSSKGRVADGEVVFDGLDETSVALPGAQYLSSSWGVLGALPRLTAAGLGRVHFTMLEELTVLRPSQRLERFGEIEAELGGSTWTLTGWRQFGTGQAPIHYWVSPGGWPMLVCGLRRGLVASYLNTSESEG